MNWNISKKNDPKFDLRLSFDYHSSSDSSNWKFKMSGRLNDKIKTWWLWRFSHQTSIFVRRWSWRGLPGLLDSLAVFGHPLRVDGRHCYVLQFGRVAEVLPDKVARFGAVTQVADVQNALVEAMKKALARTTASWIRNRRLLK